MSITKPFKPLTIYLAGKMSDLTFTEMNGWRVKTEETLLKHADRVGVKIRVINPVDYYNFEEVRYQNQREIKQFYLNCVRKSDLVVVNADGLNTSVGTAIELHEANRLDIPIVALNIGNKIDYINEVHPWLQDYITRVESNIDNLADYIKDFYMR